MSPYLEHVAWVKISPKIRMRAVDIAKPCQELRMLASMILSRVFTRVFPRRRVHRSKLPVFLRGAMTLAYFRSSLSPASWRTSRFVVSRESRPFLLL